MENQIYNILNDMSKYLNVSQMKSLQEVLLKRLCYDDTPVEIIKNETFLERFLDAKRIEGCSDRTLLYYKSTIQTMLDCIDGPIRKMNTEVIRDYLSNYQKKNNCSKTTIDNVRRNLSSFFSWLEEDHIIKSPIRRFHKVKTGTTVKEVISDENIELMRDNTLCIRDLSMIDLLLSTGIRVGELTNLDIDDINFEERECIVYGKGDKERRVYFDARTKIHLMRYLNTRTDGRKALFVSLNSPYNRLKISGVEIRLRNLGIRLNMKNVHPHKFRRTMATRAIDKGMPIEQVQKLLGHQQIDTTMRYAMVNQSNVKISHRKIIS